MRVAGERLRRLRKYSDLTQGALAKKVGIGQSHYQRVELGLNNTRPVIWLRLAQELYVSMAYFWEGSTTPESRGGGTPMVDWSGRQVQDLPPDPVRKELEAMREEIERMFVMFSERINDLAQRCAPGEVTRPK